MAICSKLEQEVLNRLIGKALLNESLSHALIDRTTRETVLSQYPLSGATRDSLLSLPTEGGINQFAEGVYTRLFLP
jgi:hypothetical protein